MARTLAIDCTLKLGLHTFSLCRASALLSLCMQANTGAKDAIFKMKVPGFCQRESFHMFYAILNNNNTSVIYLYENLLKKNV